MSEHGGIWHPIAYFSQSSTEAQTRYYASGKELYPVIVLNCEYFRVYCMHNFNVVQAVNKADTD